MRGDKSFWPTFYGHFNDGHVTTGAIGTSGRTRYSLAIRRPCGRVEKVRPHVRGKLLLSITIYVCDHQCGFSGSRSAHKREPLAIRGKADRAVRMYHQLPCSPLWYRLLI